MKTVRLNEKLEKELKNLSIQENVSESNIIREALTEYISKKTNKKPYNIGEHLFGKVGSGDNNRSTTYKSRLKTRIREKTAR